MADLANVVVGDLVFLVLGWIAWRVNRMRYLGWHLEEELRDCLERNALRPSARAVQDAETIWAYAMHMYMSAGRLRGLVAWLIVILVGVLFSWRVEQIGRTADWPWLMEMWEQPIWALVGHGLVSWVGTFGMGWVLAKRNWWRRAVLGHVSRSEKEDMPFGEPWERRLLLAKHILRVVEVEKPVEPAP